MVSIADYQATGRCFVPLALNDRFPAILNAQNPAIPSAHPHMADVAGCTVDYCKKNPRTLTAGEGGFKPGLFRLL